MSGRFEKGAPGRPKGAVSKITKELRQTLEDEDFDVGRAMLTLYKRAIAKSEAGTASDPYYFKLATDLALGLASYVFPKPKPIQESLSDVSDEEFMAEAEKRLQERQNYLNQGAADVREEQDSLTGDDNNHASN